ncbi:MAG: acyl-CoA dehydrogenase [Bacteroidetes bacterium]|nr:MAG: acyl-CoA dehydrogenase [Bacteroidota bacterium]
MALLEAAYQEFRSEVREFCEREIVPHAEKWDREEAISEDIIQKLAKKGYLGLTVPGEYGGQGKDSLYYAILNEELGRACSSVRSLVTVHGSLVSETMARWGTREQKSTLLPRLAKGELIAAYGLSEPEVGSDAKSVETSYQEHDDYYELNGQKKWITFATRADIIVIVAKNGEHVSTFLVHRTDPGVKIEKIHGMLGTSASGLGLITLENCRIPKDRLFGMKGMGFIQITNTALDNGRFSVATGALGIALASLEHSISYANERKTFGVPIGDHQLIKKKIADMTVAVKAARLLCYHAAEVRDRKDPSTYVHTTLAKYHASKAATMAATEAVQIHGAVGCLNTHPVQRLFRDARIMEIIEGTSEIQQLLLSNYALKNLTDIID